MPTSLSRAIPASIIFLLTLTAAASAQSTPTTNNQPPPPNRIEIPTAPPFATPHPITLDEIISLREIEELRISPDGRQIAYVLKQAFRDCNCNRSALYTINTDAASNPQPKKLLEESSISELRWTPDSRSISYLSAKSGSIQLWKINLPSGEPTQVFTHTATVANSREFQLDATHAAGIMRYECSHDGQRIAFTSITPATSAEKKEALEKGFLFDDRRMFQPELVMLGDWTVGRRSAELWIYRLADSREEKIWTGPSAGFFSDVSDFAWSADDQRIAIAYHVVHDEASGLKSSFSDYELATIGTNDHQFKFLTPLTGGASGLLWSRDNSQIAVILWNDTYGTISLIDSNSGEQNILAHDFYPHLGTGLFWSDAGKKLIFEAASLDFHRDNVALYDIDAATRDIRKITPSTNTVSNCDQANAGQMACVWQSPTLPPNPALIDLRAGTAQTLTDINPELKAIHLESVDHLHWKNEFGAETDGYLILPPHTPANSKPPLVIIGYGFEGDFVTQAGPYLTSYPAQPFAQNGLAVLLANYPRYKNWTTPSFENGATAFGYSPLSSLKTIIEKLAAEGKIDAKRVGFMGHSWAGFWVEFGITKSDLFTAVEIHNGGTNMEPGTYWETGNVLWSDFQDLYMGGPAYGPTLKNYVSFSPVMNGDKIHTPVMMEYDSSESLGAIEMYSTFRHYKVPVDFFVYPEDGHIFVQPEHRFYSMQRNLDWFRFWLQNYEDPDTSKSAQYTRWRALRLQHEQNQTHAAH